MGYLELHEKTEIKIKMQHGLGDNCQMVALLALYQRRGFDVAVKYEPDKKFLYDCAGIPLYDERSIIKDHICPYWPGFNMPKKNMPAYSWHKFGMYLNQRPLPYLADKNELWQELLDVIPFQLQPSDEARARVRATYKAPLVIMHGKGATSPAWKNIPDDIYCELSCKPNVLPLYDGHCSFWGNLEELACLFEIADVLIGIDSGVLQYARFSSIPVVGYWQHNTVSACSLPKPNQVNLCQKGREVDLKTWNVVEYEEITADLIWNEAQKIRRA
jgi:hypothetical protein